MSTLEKELGAEVYRRLDRVAAKRGLPPEELVRAAVERLLASEDGPLPTHSIMELEGLGAEIWKGEDGAPVDAQEYVNDLRREWDDRP